MFPILFKIGPLTIRTYGLLLAVGFASAIGLAVFRAKKKGINPDLVLDMGFYLILSGILGSRLFYIIQYPGYYLLKPWRIFKVWEGGLVFFGGLIGAVVVAIAYMTIKKVPKLSMGDLFAPSISLGQAVGRLGCFSAGCCYGTPFQGAWAVLFKDPSSLAPLNTALHPVQLYMSASNFVILFLLLWIDSRRKFPGQTLLSYLMLYPATRFVMEFFRGDDRGSFFGTFLSPAQGFGIIIFILAGVTWFWLRKKQSVETS